MRRARVSILEHKKKRQKKSVFFSASIKSNCFDCCEKTKNSTTMGLPRHLFISSEMRTTGSPTSFAVDIFPAIPAGRNDGKEFAVGLLGLTFGGTFPDRDRGVWMLSLDVVEDRLAGSSASCYYSNAMAVFQPIHYNLQFNPIKWAALPKRNIDRIRVDLRRADVPVLYALTEEEKYDITVYLELVITELPTAATTASANHHHHHNILPQQGKISVSPMYGGICHLNMQSLDC